MFEYVYYRMNLSPWRKAPTRKVMSKAMTTKLCKHILPINETCSINFVYMIRLHPALIPTQSVGIKAVIKAVIINLSQLFMFIMRC